MHRPQGGIPIFGAKHMNGPKIMAQADSPYKKIYVNSPCSIEIASALTSRTKSKGMPSVRYSSQLSAAKSVPAFVDP